MSDPEVVVLEPRAPYGPGVLRVGGDLVYEIYVASGHADRVERLPISERHAHVLSTDVERYWFLFTALHHPYQLTETRLSAERLTDYLDAILFAEQPVVEAFLTELDHGSANGALSNLLRIFVDADYSRMRDGRWFGSIPRTE
ncbi:hypothetical protein OG579_02825 [Williamsia herbipolensis]|uniref:Uncharacterized protein n=1 Tax=Williamsia herbipolensis TaxID=1603258 RepID=A0AAU4K484_9NOCA|nr:hypothetical protein [Williamsia herbipolensis]